MSFQGHGGRRRVAPRRRRAPRRCAGQDLGQVQPWPHGHCGPQAQADWVAAWVARFWQPQVHDAPGQVVQVQGVGCVVSFMVSLLGGSTTGCHRWHDFRRDGPLSTGVCDERYSCVPDRSRRSTELSGASPKAGRTCSCPQPVGCVILNRVQRYRSYPLEPSH